MNLIVNRFMAVFGPCLGAFLLLLSTFAHYDGNEAHEFMHLTGGLLFMVIGLLSEICVLLEKINER